jgi:hypothetical protein
MGAQVNKQKDTRPRGDAKDLWGDGWRNLKEAFGDNPILRFFGKNPTFGLSLLYLYVTGMGLVYAVTLYGKFGINIIDYSTVADFLLAAFQKPLIFAYTVGFAILQVVTPLIGVFFEGLHRGTIWLGILAGLAVVSVSVSLMFVSGRDAASSIKRGEYPPVDVSYRAFSGTAGQVTESGLQHIGATQKAVFFYDVDARPKRTLVIPQSQIVSIKVPE